MRNLRLTTLAAMLVLATLVLPASALAHSNYSKSSPGATTRVDRDLNSLRIVFTQPFNASLTKIELLDTATGLPYETRLSVPRPGVAVVTPQGGGSLPEGAYRIRWHTVGGYDGHVLEGTFGFGVRAAAVDGEPRITSSPFKGWGLLRVSFRSVMLIALFFFAGGVLVPALLRVPGGFSAWLVPRDERNLEHGAFLRRLEKRTLLSGWITVGAGATAVLVEAIDAGGSPAPRVLGAFLLTNVSGLSRLAMLSLLAAAVVLLPRRVNLAAAAVSLAFVAMAVGGHAYMPSHRWVAMTSDTLHLIAAAVWAGGIAQLALTWVPRIFGRSGALRRAVMRDVLNGFGKIAMPAFGIVAICGSTNALIRLGRLSALWETGYGRVLFVKMLIVGLISMASYLHAMKLRPRLLANIRPQPALEKRHWRLIGGECALIGAAIAAVAVLVASPLPASPKPAAPVEARPAAASATRDAAAKSDRSSLATLRAPSGAASGGAGK